jgi:endonuclease/exonuclease/phosphatase family metal-dependent hydrolase
MFAYSHGTGRWGAAPRQADPPLTLERLRVVTYNVWFDPFEAQRRCAALLEILAGQDADVIALEEVTQPFLDNLLAARWVRDAYLISQSHVDPTLRYDVVMLSRVPARFRAHALTSIMGRRLHTLDIDTAEGELTIAGIHLESMREMTSTRLIQIQECLPTLGRAASSVWLGDFNAAPDSAEDARIRAHFVDVWPALQDGPGYTRDTSRNAMLARIKDDRHQRIDRVFLRSSHLVPADIRLLGTSPLEGTDGQVFASDHFGLVAELARVGARGAAPEQNQG